MMEALKSQHVILKPEYPPASPKRPKKMRYDKSPLPPQKTDTQYVPACRIQGWERFGVPHPAPPLLFLTYRKQKRVMTVVTKLMTLNINGIKNRTIVGMLTEYIRRHDLDIVFLQEITDPELLTMRGYDRYYNIGSHRRGTAIVARNDIALTTINKIPSGRTIAAEYLGLRIVIIYAPSGTAIRAERENFYNAEIPHLLQTGHGEMILGETSIVSLTRPTHPATSILAGPSPR